VDVVVPFRGSPADLDELRDRLAALELGPGDSLVVVDNTPGQGSAADTGLPTPGFARNRGAGRGSADWLVFLDADVAPAPDLLEGYFDTAPGERTGLLAGGVLDQAVPAGGRAAARYAYVHGLMGQDSLHFPKTANAAVRRTAFEQVGGFREDIRAAEDADLAWRLEAAGWEIEPRERAVGVHLNRQTLPAFVRQKLTWGAGAAWLDGAYPGAFPARRRPGLVWWGIRHAASGLAYARDRDARLVAVLEPLEQIAYELGRSLPNERPLLPWRRA
jgi:hypothetical protein